MPSCDEQITIILIKNERDELFAESGITNYDLEFAVYKLKNRMAFEYLCPDNLIR